MVDEVENVAVVEAGGHQDQLAVQLQEEDAVVVPEWAWFASPASFKNIINGDLPRSSIARCPNRKSLVPYAVRKHLGVKCSNLICS